MTDDALDLRPGELALVVPLVALLCSRCRPGPQRSRTTRSRRRARRTPSDDAIPMISTPHVDWFAIATILALLGASFVALLGAVLVPRTAARLRRDRLRARLRRRARAVDLALREQRRRRTA